MWDGTRENAWSRAAWFAAAACCILPGEADKERVKLKAEKLSANGLDFSRSEDAPCLAVVKVVEVEGPDKHKREERRACLLSGRVMLNAAALAGAAVPVYPLPPQGEAALLDAGLLNLEAGHLTDKPAAIALLVKLNLGTAAELLSDNGDPVDPTPSQVAAGVVAEPLTPEEPAAR